MLFYSKSCGFLQSYFLSNFEIKLTKNNKNTIEALLTPKEIERYSRQIVMPELAMEGQEKLKSAKVLLLGAGGLGSPISLYLAAAGIGTLGIVDFDNVSYSNLQRQVLYASEDVGMSKVETAKAKLAAINPNVEIITYNIKLTSENALDIIRDYDIVADGSDNFATRYLVNDTCVLLKKPVVYGSILRFEGQVSFFDSAYGPCYRCLYPEPPAAGEVPSCEEGGVIGVLPGIIGSIQANEVIKYIIGKGELLSGRLLTLDALKMKFKELKFEKNSECSVCGTRPTITELIDYEEFCGTKKRQNNFEDMTNEITAAELKRKIDNKEKVFLLDVREQYESDIATIGGKLIPVNSLPYRFGEITCGKDDEIVVYCHIGVRSAYAVEYLRDQHGYKNVKTLLGGIEAWSLEIDPEVKRY